MTTLQLHETPGRGSYSKFGGKPNLAVLDVFDPPINGTFRTSEIICLLELRVPRVPKGAPSFRLQNFLCGVEDWRTNTGGSLHIGERGELNVLRAILGKRLSRIEITRKAYTDKIYRRELRKKGDTAHTFPTEKDYWNYVKAVEKELGCNIKLTL